VNFQYHINKTSSDGLKGSLLHSIDLGETSNSSVLHSMSWCRIWSLNIENIQPFCNLDPKRGCLQILCLINKFSPVHVWPLYVCVCGMDRGFCPHLLQYRVFTVSLEMINDYNRCGLKSHSRLSTEREVEAEPKGQEGIETTRVPNCISYIGHS